LKVGILAAGRTPRALQPQFGDYVSMFEGLLAGRGYDWASYDVPAGDYPDEPEACDGYILTGAAAGVYDGDPWIDELFQFLRAARGRAKLVGICFGHQAMAQAFGGRVVRHEPVHGKVCEVEHDGRTIFSGLPSPLTVGRYHSLVAEESSLPAELEVSARGGGVIQAIRHRTLPAEGIQFHPESVLTPDGMELLRSFLAAGTRTAVGGIA
jgi:GMP synthase-like glutamine amidotransferase